MEKFLQQFQVSGIESPRLLVVTSDRGNAYSDCYDGCDRNCDNNCGDGCEA